MTLLNKKGIAKNGDMMGYNVMVIYDEDSTGGYYILFSKDHADSEAEGYDELYFDFKDVERRIQELNVLWLCDKEEVDE